MGKLREKFDSVKFHLAEAGNITNPALLILRDKGYEIGVEPPEEENSSWNWWAEKDGNLFTGSNPAMILGLISIWETRGENWQTQENEEWLFDKFLDEAYPNQSG